MSNMIMIVDDDPVQRRLLGGIIEKLGHKCVLAEGGRQALQFLESDKGSEIQLMILDLVMPEMDGIEVLETLQTSGKMLPVIVQTAQGGIETVVKAMRAGAFDFVVKPASPERLKLAIGNAKKLASKLTTRDKDVKSAAKKSVGTLSFDDLVSTSSAMMPVIKLGRKAAQSRIPVLIEGESGVGKEVFARAVQSASERKSKPFVTVNCGALPENLVESILFGHEKGSFTGATDKRIGKFEEANGGTLFLDEIGELPLEAQVKLLRAIQEGEVDPVGSRTPVKVNIRLISATNKNLYDEVSKGRFREDLYYRLNVLPITVPPLRARREDIPALVNFFISRIAAEEGREDVKGIDITAMRMLCSFDWPGNIRQLANAVFRAVVLSEGGMLSVEEFAHIAAQMPDQVENLAAARAKPVEVETMDGTSLHGAPEEGGSTVSFYDVPPAMVTPLSMDSSGWVNVLDEAGEVRKFTDVEAEVIALAIDHYNGRMSEVARRLSIGRSTLYRKLKEYGLEETRFGNE